jgi:hypothetical protein
MENTQESMVKKNYLFNVDILIESDTNGRALEKLLHLLNTADVQDYLVKEGIHLGSQIQTIMQETISKQQSKPDIITAMKLKNKADAATGKKSKQEDPQKAIWDQFRGFKESNSLIRLTIVKPMGVKLSIPCRILNVDSDSSNVSVYHVDERQVYLFKINEIDDFSVS